MPTKWLPQNIQTENWHPTNTLQLKYEQIMAYFYMKDYTIMKPKLLIHIITWMNLKNIILREVRHKRIHTLCDSIPKYESTYIESRMVKINLWWLESDKWLPWGRRKGWGREVTGVIEILTRIMVMHLSKFIKLYTYALWILLHVHYSSIKKSLQWVLQRLPESRLQREEWYSWGNGWSAVMVGDFT